MDEETSVNFASLDRSPDIWLTAVLTDFPSALFFAVFLAVQHKSHGSDRLHEQQPFEVCFGITFVHVSPQGMAF